MNYYNEIDPKAAAWVSELIRAGLIPDGFVDTRSIAEVQPKDLHGYDQCHFFAGIGGWAYATQLAGWPDDVPLWTGSCPCQPFSAAGPGSGFADERHLWPAWCWLIQQCQPRYVCGEQVASTDALRWWDLVATDLEGAGYACTAVDLPAASVGAPHKRSRLFWVAHAVPTGRAEGWPIAGIGSSAIRGTSGLMADAERSQRGQKCVTRQNGCDRAHDRRRETHGKPRTRSEVRDVADACGERCDRQPVCLCERGSQQAGAEVAGSSGVGDMADAISERGRGGESRRGNAADAGIAGETCSFWADCVWLPCTDGKARPTQPGLFPLATGVPNRVGTLRGAGNAIVPQVAAEVLSAWWNVTR